MGGLIGLSILWGGSFFFTHMALDALPPFTLVALRADPAAVALHLILVLSEAGLPRGTAIWAPFRGMGV